MYLNQKQEAVNTLNSIYWTLTWDVFKLSIGCFCFTPKQNWTLTWDVFK